MAELSLEAGPLDSQGFLSCFRPSQMLIRRGESSPVVQWVKDRVVTATAWVAAVTQVRSLAWELPYAEGVDQK